MNTKIRRWVYSDAIIPFTILNTVVTLYIFERFDRWSFDPFLPGSRPEQLHAMTIKHAALLIPCLAGILLWYAIRKITKTPPAHRLMIQFTIAIFLITAGFEGLPYKSVDDISVWLLLVGLEGIVGALHLCFIMFARRHGHLLQNKQWQALPTIWILLLCNVVLMWFGMQWIAYLRTTNW